MVFPVDPRNHAAAKKTIQDPCFVPRDLKGVLLTRHQHLPQFVDPAYLTQRKMRTVLEQGVRRAAQESKDQALSGSAATFMDRACKRNRLQRGNSGPYRIRPAICPHKMLAKPHAPRNPDVIRSAYKPHYIRYRSFPFPIANLTKK